MREKMDMALGRQMALPMSPLKKAREIGPEGMLETISKKIDDET